MPLLKQVLEVLDVVDSPEASGKAVQALFARAAAMGTATAAAAAVTVTVERVRGDKGETDFVKVTIPGEQGKLAGGTAPTLGIIGRLGGLGARPEQIGFVSDGDGAAAALAAALKLAEMRVRGDVLAGDVIVATHVCPDAPTQPHDPVPFMGSPVDPAMMNVHEVDPAMDGIFSIDTTKGNRLVNHRGIALSAPVKEGWILRLGDGLLDLYQNVTGCHPVILPINMQDITPYGNGVHHLNSIMQPAVATRAPVVGIAITTVAMVPGSATGASHEADIALAATFAVEAAKLFGRGKLSLYDPAEYQRLVGLYGSMHTLQKQHSAGV